MKIASIIMSLVFAGVIAQANDPAHTGHAAPAAPAAPAATTEKVEKKVTTKKGKHAADAKTVETKTETKTEEKH